MARPPAIVVDWWLEERVAIQRGFKVVAGIDEAGRGPLAGPVVAACVVLPHGVCPDGVRDSKKMTPLQRDRAFDAIHGCAEAIGVGVAEVHEIDTINILRASHEAMRRALSAAGTADVALIDGLPVQPFPIPQISIVQGDGRSASIAAASVIAKVTRDRMMLQLHEQFPQYGFAEHKGYSTPEHLASLRKHGPCPIHRRGFAPVEELLTQPSLALDDAPDTRQATGESGEEIAAAHLRSLGMEILERRYHCRGGEIDLVARDGESTAFVEVKARRSQQFGSPVESVGAHKRQRMVTAALDYFFHRGGEPSDCRFDIAEVHFGADGRAKVNLIRNAFIAGE